MGRTGLGPPHQRITLLSEEDLWLFAEGRHTRVYERLGSHPMDIGGSPGVYFATWAPEAARVSVMGDFNGWDPEAHPMRLIAGSGIWECPVVGAGRGDRYKYRIVSRHGTPVAHKADPFGAWTERRPGTASRVWAPCFRWDDREWMESRSTALARDAPVAIYEVHPGSWRRVPEEGNRPLTYRELAETLPDYVADLGFSHVELMPVTEYPYGPSWGYQTTGYFSPTSRYGYPEDLMFLIDRLHRRGIGVILDWVPSHFATDEHGLARFDGSHLYEHADPRQGIHPDWGSAIFNYGRNEVRSFLLSSALSWLDRYHIDGLRVDAVASMLYLDYSRADGEWVPNEEGGRANLAAVHFLRDLNTAINEAFPGVRTFAEESTSWPGVTSPVHHGGLGFGYKWDMGWMHDTLSYLERDAIHRSHHHAELTFRSVYAGAERFVLPLSHDEVVHGKGSLLSRMWGDPWQSFANLRLLYTHMFTTPGKKLLFMGGEFAQADEWRHDGSLDWHLLDDSRHRGIRALVSDLATAYRSVPALHRGDHEAGGFAWVDADDRSRSVLSYLRRDPQTGDIALVVLNCTPVPRFGYRVPVPRDGYWRELINSDAREYGGTGVGNLGGSWTRPAPDGASGGILSLSLPPLGGVVLALQDA
ncbi:MAG: 1,4-alpha-glucan branching protein GlgB [bacterium]|nr:1,4-alpha-glucan branching protein GlgB [bacterium]MDE0289076.1 1,4-alpha-glucan branching protein GlgB [bacterium]MDE0439382.1 1,4-alpha-glucan branching protein GlgB [bacterium]